MCRPTTGIDVVVEESTVSSSQDNTNTPTTVSSKTSQWNKMNAAVATHPVTMDDFYKQYPSFIWGPMVVAGLLYTSTTYLPSFMKYLQSNNMEYFGWTSAWQYTVFAIASSFAFHGFCVTFAPKSLKIQADTEYQVKPDAMAIRSTAALLTSLIYTFMPFCPDITDQGVEGWLEFLAWTAVLAVYWDAHFYVAHRYAHKNKAAYRFFHKMHHLCKEPNCFGAYFVTYQSHILLEQLVVFIMAMLGLPRNVFTFYLYWGTIGTYVEHSGFELGSMVLPFIPIPISFGQFSQGMGISTSLFLEGKLCFGLMFVFVALLLLLSVPHFTSRSSPYVT
jgi:sterol desaturase/sphingolipid hydroxylase (fatty acid hydroxylase superfamily)